MTTNKMNLYEGLFKGDLEGMVSPLIVIDEYESKIEEDGIVAAFFCDEEPAAKDLSYFIEHSYVELLDTEVSPAPNEDAKFLVFVEFERDEKFIKNLLLITDLLYGPTLNKNWKFKNYKDDNIYELNEENLLAHIRLHGKDEVNESIEESIYSFFRTSLLDDVKLKGQKLVLERRGMGKKKFVLEGFFTHQEIEDYLKDKIIKLDESSVSQCRKIEKYLGYSWNCHKIDEHYILTSNDNDLYLMVK